MAVPVLRVGLIGYGTVGQSFTHHLSAASDRIAERLGVRLQLHRVAVKHAERARPFLHDVKPGNDPVALVQDPAIDLVVEATGAHEASEWLTLALRRGIPAISANKQAIASSDTLLRAIADRHPLFHCEGAVAAAIPVIRALRDSLDGEDILDVRGVLNGTSTFVLSQVETGIAWEAALRAAEEAGYAERNGTDDLDGSDAAAKLAILATTAWRTPLSRDRVAVRGLDARAAATATAAFAEGRRLRLVAEGWLNGTPRLVVEPRVLDATDPLASVSGVTNGVELTAVLAGQLRWFGPGAGGDHTASALLGDVAAAVRVLRHTSARRAAA